MSARPGESARGNALVIATVFIAVLIATSGGMLGYALERSKAATERYATEQTLRAIDVAVGVKLAKLMRFEDRSLYGTLADGTRYAVVVRPHPMGDLFRITAAALSASGSAQVVEVVAARHIAAGQSAFPGAIMAKQQLTTSGNSQVDGNNHDLTGALMRLGVVNADGTRTSANDKVGMASKQSIALGGSTQARGCGDYGWNATNKNLKPGDDGSFPTVDANQNVLPNATIWGSTATDHFPTTPDQALASPDGTAKARAQELGTYFTSQAQYDAWVSALPGGVSPPNQLIYLDFGGTGINLGNVDWGNTYHTIINHHPVTPEVILPRYGISGLTNTAYVADASGNLWVGGSPPAGCVPAVYDGYGWVKTEPDGDSVIQSPHTTFWGCFIIDDMSNMNSQTIIYGGICSLQKDAGSAHNLCNGGAYVGYSAPAIDRAIAENLFTGVSYQVKEYREHPQTYDAQLACEKIGAGVRFRSGFTPEDTLDTSATPASSATRDGWSNPWGTDPGNAARSNPSKVNWVSDQATP